MKTKLFGVIATHVFFWFSSASYGASYNFITLDDPSASPGTTLYTIATGINNLGQVVGFYSSGNTTQLYPQ